jgi:hypothetical protein
MGSIVPRSMTRKQKKYVKTIAKKVYVNGFEFDSCLDAARYIVTSEPEKETKFMTIAKEIRRMLQGYRKEWKMYNKFKIARSL